LIETGQARIDKERETAKNYLFPFLPINRHNITNIEFSEVVDLTTEFQKIVDPYQWRAHIDRWKLINKFLYDTDIWHSIPLKRLYEAEVEINLQKSYIYE
jgi:predicted metal-dependent HD superfamily phosphohydrolase